MITKKATKKPVEIKYSTYEELLNYGKKYVDGLNNSIFEITKGNPVEIKYDKNLNEIIYIRIPTFEGVMEMTKNDVLIIGVQGEIYPCKKDIFEKTYNYES